MVIEEEDFKFLVAKAGELIGMMESHWMHKPSDSIRTFRMKEIADDKIKLRSIKSKHKE